MRFFTHLAILFYLTVISFISGIAILFASQGLSFLEIAYFLEVAYYDIQIRIMIFGISIIIVLLSLIFAKVITGGRQRERTIAFENPSGRVSISLSALEDLIRRAVFKIIEVKEIKPSIIASKKGILVDCRVVLRSEVTIPEITARLQNSIKERVQDVLGVDEDIFVRIHIIKIISEIGKNKHPTSQESLSEKEQLSVPFQGYHQ